MIGKLRGVIDTYGDDFVVIDVHGVGYVVHCSVRTLQSLPPQGEAATISIETHVREQEIKLFGFTNDLEREWFRILQTVQGVGAKVALAILSTLKPAELANAIALGDKTAVSRTPGAPPWMATEATAGSSNRTAVTPDAPRGSSAFPTSRPGTSVMRLRRTGMAHLCAG